MPLASHALMSGIHAGHLAGRVLRGGMSATVATDTYSRWIREWFANDLIRLGELYAQIPGLHLASLEELAGLRGYFVK